MPRLRLLPPVTAAETPEQAAPILNYLMNRGGPVAIDTETTGLDVMRSRVLFWSMATEDRRYFFPYELLGFFDPLFQRRDITWYLANAKYDMHILRNMGYGLVGDVWDIIDMDAMEDDTRDHGLKDQAWFAYEARWGEFKELFLDPHMVSESLGLDKYTFAKFKKMEGGDKLNFVYNEQPELVQNYASCDSYFTFMRAQDLAKNLANVGLESTMTPMASLFDYYRTIEVPLTKVLWGMERAGFLVDLDWVKKIEGPMKDGIAAAEKKLYDLMGYRFNTKAEDEIRDILYGKDHFGMKPIKFTSGGKGSEPKPSVDEKTLNILKLRVSHDSPEFQFIDAKLALAKLNKLYGTYVKKIRTYLGPDGRVHCRLNQSGARTSRLSSSNPNMQNIPVRNDPYKIRGCFIADPGYDLIDFDYPQIEFRIAAALAGEEEMMEAIRKGWDIHSANAAAMYKSDPLVTYEAIMAAKDKKDRKDPSFGDIDKYLLKKRDGAKTSGLGALYGEGAGKMAQDLKCSKEEAQELIDTFFRTNANIEAHIEYMHRFAEANEYTYTMLGRVRRLYRINNAYNRGIAAAERRQAYNTLIQGSGSEMMKLAMLQIAHDKEFNELGGILILTVHDELIARAPKETSRRCAEIMKEKMGDPYNWGPIRITYPVPVDPDGAVGHRWTDVK
jgi:DNA polymerase I-like protein with 3'-5' exonuclease and polymerase domains